MKSRNKREELIKQNLELVQQFLLEVVRHPDRVAHIPNDATLILYPVLYKHKQAA